MEKTDSRACKDSQAESTGSTVSPSASKEDNGSMVGCNTDYMKDDASGMEDIDESMEYTTGRENIRHFLCSNCSFSEKCQKRKTNFEFTSLIARLKQTQLIFAVMRKNMLF